MRMPFTPFHFGVGVAAKAVLPRGFSLILFVALQVVIDLESLYNLVHDRYPVHRFLHTFVGAALLAILSAIVLFPILRWRWRTPRPARVFAALLATALFATWSHVILDGIMHADARPFWPWSDSNPLLRRIGLGTLHLACLALGVFGLIALAFRWSMQDSETR